MDERPEQIEQHIRHQRSELEDNFSELEEKVKGAFDWKTQVRRASGRNAGRGVRRRNFAGGDSTQHFQHLLGGLPRGVDPSRRYADRDERALARESSRATQFLKPSASKASAVSTASVGDMGKPEGCRRSAWRVRG